MKVTQRELGAWIERELAMSEGYGGGELAEVRKQALDRYYGRPRGDEVAGRSIVQSSDVADMVEAVIAQMLPGFSGDSVVEFEPTGSDDVEAAQLESDIVNSVIIEANRGYTMFQEALRDALLLRNGWVKVWHDESEEVSTIKLRGVPEEAVGVAIDRAPEGLKLKLVETEDVGNGLVNAELTAKRKRSRLRVTSVDPVNMRWQKDFPSVFLDDIRFLAECWYPSRSELIAQGYSRSKVDALPAGSAQWAVDQQARNQGQSTPQQAPDRSMECVDAWWIHYRYDSDGDGIAELHCILYVKGPEDGSILYDEVVDFVPYATGSAFLQPHRLNGLGLYDKLRQTEYAKTSILRQWIDNLAVANNSRVGINTRVVNIDDATDSRPGGIIRVNGEVGANMVPLPMVDVGQSAMLALEYQDKIRSERGGASLDLQSAQLQIAGDTAHGVERQVSSKEQMAAMMSRTLAETLVRQTYILAHRGMRAWIDEPITAKRAGEYVQSNPAEWPMRERVNVSTGLSVGERGAKRAALETVLMQQEKLVAAGYDGILVSAQQYHSALMDWARSAAIDNADRYFTDPASQGSQQAAQQKSQKAEQASTMQLQIANEAATGQQQAARIEQMMKKYQIDRDNEFKYWNAVLSAEIEGAKLGAAAEDESDMEEVESMGLVRSMGGGAA